MRNVFFFQPTPFFPPLLYPTPSYPTALWMQESLKKDETPKEEMHEFMHPILHTLAGQHKAETFCEHLRDRAGLIADYAW